MMEMLVILAPAAVLILLMLVTHTYFGLHVLARGIIFVDLALAQVAALGVAVAFMLGFDAHGFEGQLFALGATLIAAAAFAGLRRLPDKTTREVAIGCVYVVATALSIVILSRSVHGAEELEAMLNGNILWIGWRDIGSIAIVYALLLLFHLAFRERFVALSFGSENNSDTAFRWEFLFFASFALVITLAVSRAGVLLVFALLIIPAFTAALWTARIWPRLLLGWALGLLGSFVGLALSFFADLPTGATVVAVLGLLPLLTGVLHLAGVGPLQTSLKGSL